MIQISAIVVTTSQSNPPSPDEACAQEPARPPPPKQQSHCCTWLKLRFSSLDFSAVRGQSQLEFVFLCWSKGWARAHSQTEQETSHERSSPWNDKLLIQLTVRHTSKRHLSGRGMRTCRQFPREEQYAKPLSAHITNRQHQDRHISQVSPNFQKPTRKRASVAPCAFLISRILVCTAESHWSCKACTAGTTTFVGFLFSTILLCYEHAGVRQEALESTRQLMTYRSKSLKQLVTGHPSEQKGPWVNRAHRTSRTLSTRLQRATPPRLCSRVFDFTGNARLSCQLNSDNAPQTAVTQNMRSSGVTGWHSGKSQGGTKPSPVTNTKPARLSLPCFPATEPRPSACASPILTTGLGKECSYVAVLVHAPQGPEASPPPRHRPHRQCPFWLHLPFSSHAHAKNTHAAAFPYSFSQRRPPPNSRTWPSTFSSSSSSPRTAPTAFLRLAFIFEGLKRDLAPSTVTPMPQQCVYVDRSPETAEGRTPPLPRAR